MMPQCDHPRPERKLGHAPRMQAERTPANLTLDQTYVSKNQEREVNLLVYSRRSLWRVARFTRLIRSYRTSYELVTVVIVVNRSRQ